MSTRQLPSERSQGDRVPRVSLRTLILMLELLAAVVVLQYLAAVQPVQADAAWLGDAHPTAVSVPAPAGANPVTP